MESRSIDWQSTEVVSSDGGLEVTVALDGTPSPVWGRLFAEKAVELDQQNRGAWKSMSLAGADVVVAGVTMGSVDKVEEHLRQAVADTNHLAELHRQKEEAAAAKAKETAEALRREATDMQEKLRSRTNE